jgi:hypothetical protein
MAFSNGARVRRWRSGVLSLTLALSVVAACTKESPEQPFSGSAKLTWTVVKTDTRGKALPDIAGYKIRYGTSPTALYNVVVLKDPKQTTYVVRDLYPGMWYFAVSAYTAGGTEGAQSNVAAKRIR